MTRILGLLIFIFLLSACGKDNEPKTFPLNEKQQAVIDAGNQFGLSLFQEVNIFEKEGKNIFISPLSISMALGMTLNGAYNSTLDQMKTAMFFSKLSNDNVNKTYRYLLDNLISLDPKVSLQIANSIWYKNTFNVLPDFLNTNISYFDATVSPLDFNDPTAKDVINNWVKTKTNDKIKTIIDQIEDNMVMYLINAIYFKGQWKYQFKKTDTRNVDFIKTDNTIISVPMMHLKSDMKFLVNDLFRAVELPYGEGNYSMLVMVPEGSNNVNHLVDALNPENWNNWLSAMHVSKDADINLPKFKFEYELKMNNVLKAMGMTEAFEAGMADFSRINPDADLYITEVKHKSFVEVNEEGTEAAAVTSVGIGFTSMPDNYFIANKPFLFIIKEKNTNAILFIGKIMEPVN